MSGSSANVGVLQAPSRRFPVPASNLTALRAALNGGAAVQMVSQFHRTLNRRAQAQPGVVQRALGDSFDWHNAGSVKRSGEGAEGVLFVTSAADEIVVKFLKAAAGPSVADETMRAAGVSVPDSRIVPNSDSDPLGAAIRAAINRKLTTLTAAAQAQVTTQLTTYKYIQLQSKTTGTGLDKLLPPQLGAFLQDAALLSEVGKIAAIDSFLGNTDRLTRKTANTGNYMLVNGATSQTLVAIDNELHAKAASSESDREAEVRFILSDAGINVIATTFIAKLVGAKYAPSDQELAFTKQHIKSGVLAGAQAIIQLIQTQPDFISRAKRAETKRLPGPEGTGTKKREIVRATLKARVEAMKEEHANLTRVLAAV